MQIAKVRWLSVALVSALIAVSAGTTLAGASGSGQTHHVKKVIFIIAGSQSDHGYYQSQVEAMRAAAKAGHYQLTVVDEVQPADGEAAFQAAVRQNPSLILGDYDLSDGFTAACQQAGKTSVGWIGESPLPPQCKYAAQVYQDNSQAHYLTGYAVGLYLKGAAKPNGTLVTVAGAQLSFVESDNAALKQGLLAADPSAHFRITFTGDFDNAALATEATKAQIAQGADVIYPYLAGALVASYQAATAAGVPLVAQGPLCGAAGASLGHFVAAILNSPAAFLPSVVTRYAAGKLPPGTSLIFHVDTPGIGAALCNATPSQQSQLDAARQRLLSGQVKIVNDPTKQTRTPQ